MRQLLRQYPIPKVNLSLTARTYRFIKRKHPKTLLMFPRTSALLRTVLENLNLGIGENTKLSLDEAVEYADFKKDLEFLTDGLNTIVGESESLYPAVKNKDYRSPGPS